MKHALLLSKMGTLCAAAAIICAGLLQPAPVVSHSSGAPAGHSGSLADNASCQGNGCHSGPSPTIVTDWISSNIPSSGYVPNTTYTITATATRAGHSRFGFEVSPQSNSGQLLGTLINTSAQTQLIGASKYITHTASGTFGNGGTKSWTFNWLSPNAGTGSVTFYGAFNVANANNNAFGDTIFRSTLSVSEDLSTGISLMPHARGKILVYPTLAHDQLFVKYHSSMAAAIVVEIFDIAGRKCAAIASEIVMQSGDVITINTHQLNAGQYIVKCTAGDQVHVQKIIVAE